MCPENTLCSTDLFYSLNVRRRNILEEINAYLLSSYTEGSRAKREVAIWTMFRVCAGGGGVRRMGER